MRPAGAQAARPGPVPPAPAARRQCAPGVHASRGGTTTGRGSSRPSASWRPVDGPMTIAHPQAAQNWNICMDAPARLTQLSGAQTRQGTRRRCLNHE